MFIFVLSPVRRLSVAAVIFVDLLAGPCRALPQLLPLELINFLRLEAVFNCFEVVSRVFKSVLSGLRRQATIFPFSILFWEQFVLGFVKFLLVIPGSFLLHLGVFCRILHQDFLQFGHPFRFWIFTGYLWVLYGSIYFYAEPKIYPVSLCLLVLSIPGPYSLQVNFYWDNIGTLEWIKKVQIFIWHWIKGFFSVKGNSFVVTDFLLAELLYREDIISASDCGYQRKDDAGEDSRIQSGQNSSRLPMVLEKSLTVYFNYNSRRRKDRNEEFYARDANRVVDRIYFHVLDIPHAITWFVSCPSFLDDLYLTDHV